MAVTSAWVRARGYRRSSSMVPMKLGAFAYVLLPTKFCVLVVPGVIVPDNENGLGIPCAYKLADLPVTTAQTCLHVDNTNALPARLVPILVPPAKKYACTDVLPALASCTIIEFTLLPVAKSTNLMAPLLAIGIIQTHTEKEVSIVKLGT